MGHSPGAPHKLTDKQKQELVQIVTYQTPNDLGISTTYNWTLSLVSKYIEQEWGRGIHFVEFQDFWKLLVLRLQEPLIPGKGRQRSLIISLLKV